MDRSLIAIKNIAYDSQPPSPASAGLSDTWAHVVTQLITHDAVKSMVRELALQSQLDSQNGPSWMLRIEKESLNNPVLLEKLQAAINAQRPVENAIELTATMGEVTDTPVRRNQAAAQARQVQAEALINSDPLVLDLIRNWGAKVVPGSIKTIARASAAGETKAQPI